VAEYVTGLAEVGAAMSRVLTATSLGPLVPELLPFLTGGKLLRARLLFSVGPAAGVARPTLVQAAAAIEMVHTASLLHDDVIDGAALRRGAPTFWRERGVGGAILLGDLLVCRSVQLLEAVEGGRLGPVLVRLAGRMCEAEAEQTLLRSGVPVDWESCVRLARDKTGSLFAFAAHVCGGRDQALCAALEEAGLAIGTVYQLADDLLDFSGEPAAAGKSLGLDRPLGRPTTVAAGRELPGGPHAEMARLCAAAERRLAEWPAVRQAWTGYVDEVLQPVLAACTRDFCRAD